MTSLTITAPENRLALIWQDKIQALRPPLWESIAISIREEAIDYRHRCPLCDQWLIKARGLGHHFMAYHPQAFNALVTARQQARASRKSLALCSPCRYCRSTCSGHPTKHVAECPVIILARCTALLLATGAHNCLDSTVQDGSVRAGHPGGATGGSSRPHGSSDSGNEGSKLRKDTGLPNAESASGLVCLLPGRMGHLGRTRRAGSHCRTAKGGRDVASRTPRT